VAEPAAESPEVAEEDAAAEQAEEQPEGQAQEQAVQSEGVEAAEGEEVEEDDWGDDPFASSAWEEAPAAPGPVSSPAEVAAGAAADDTAEAPPAAAHHAATQEALPVRPADAAAPHSSSSSGGAAPCSSSPAVLAARQLVLDLLAALTASSSPSLQLHTLLALRAFFQQQQATVAGGGGTLPWALQCAAAGLPGALGRVRQLMLEGGRGPRLTEADIQARGSYARVPWLWRFAVALVFLCGVVLPASAPRLGCLRSIGGAAKCCPSSRVGSFAPSAVTPLLTTCSHLLTRLPLLPLLTPHTFTPAARG
jgi:hypothetical protein